MHRTSRRVHTASEREDQERERYRITIAGNFRGRRLLRISQFFSHPQKFSPQNSRHATPIMQPVLTFCESFLRDMLLSHRSVKNFSLKNFRYTVGRERKERERRGEGDRGEERRERVQVHYTDLITVYIYTHQHVHVHLARPLHLLSTGCYAIQSVVISFIINTLLSTPAFLPVDLHSLPLPLLCSSLISIVVACMAYPHYIYSGKSTVLFLIDVSYDAVQVTTGTLAIYSLALAFN